MMQSISTLPPYLSLAIWLPVLFGVLVLALGRDSNPGATRLGALVGSLISLAATIPLITHFDNAAHGMQFVELQAVGGIVEMRDQRDGGRQADQRTDQRTEARGAGIAVAAQGQHQHPEQDRKPDRQAQVGRKSRN